MNSFGRIFRISIFGESHGKSVGIVVDGCPAGITLAEIDLEGDLARRKSGGKGTTSRREEDKPVFLSGVHNCKTTGSPIAVMFHNADVISSDYDIFRDVPRPGHANFVAKKKYGGFSDIRGGGHFSGRLTLGLVTAGVIAKKIIHPIHVKADLIEAGGQKNIDKAIQKAIKSNDSIGGIIECRSLNMPVGLGEPFFDSVESLISHLVFSIPGVKAIEFGSGFKAAVMTGIQHNDPIITISGKTKTNHAGGINGGITNSNDLMFRIAVKPTASISKKQYTMNTRMVKMVDLEVKGRHDLCIALRIPVIVEAATAVVLADLMMINKTISRRN
jgi:chorismate synthase